MNAASQKTADNQYLEIILNRISVCRKYKPAFGQGRKVAFAEFQQLYSADPFYAWFGLNDALVYAAHRTAGGITSIYRQKRASRTYLCPRSIFWNRYNWPGLR